MLSDYPMSEGEAYSMPMRFRREERNEDLVQIGRRNAVAGVAN